jgi:hypothetical protein
MATSLFDAQSGGPDITFGTSSVQGGDSGPSMADVVAAGGGAAGDLIRALGLGGQPTFDPQGQMQSQAMQEQRRGERDMTSLGGSFLMPTQAASGPNIAAPLGAPLMPTQGDVEPEIFAPPGAESMPTQFESLLNLSPAQFDAALGELGINTALPSGSVAPGDTSWLGASAGGAQALLGLLNAYSGGSQGNFLGAAGGGLQTVAGLADLLKASPQLQQLLLGGNLSAGAAGAIGGGVGSLGGILNLINGIQSGDPLMSMQGAGGLLQGLGGLGVEGAGMLGGTLGGLAGAGSLYQGIEEGDPLQALSGAAALYGGAVPIINALAGTSIPTLSGLAGQALTAIAPQLAQSLGITAGTTAATTGATAGATSAAAGATGALAAAPLAAMVIATSLYNMGEQKQQAYNLSQRFKGLTSSIPGHIAAFQKAPGILDRIMATNDPQEAAGLYVELDKIYRDFETSGMEDFLQHGTTDVRGRGTSGGMGAEFPQGPLITDALKIYGQALDYGRLVAQDKAARGGITVANALPADSYALTLGEGGFDNWFRPMALTDAGFGVNPTADPTVYTYPRYGELGYIANEFGRYMPATFNMNEAPGPEVFDLLARYNPAFKGLTGNETVTTQTPVPIWVSTGEGGYWEDTGQMQSTTRPKFTRQDIANYLRAGGAGKGEFDQMMNTFQNVGYGPVNINLLHELQAMAPGTWEQGIRDMMTREGFTSSNPYFAAAPQIAQAQQQAQQQQAQAFADFQRQLQDLLSQNLSGALTGPQSTGLPFATPPVTLGPDFAATYAGLTQPQRNTLTVAGLDPELLRQLGWQV